MMVRTNQTDILRAIICPVSINMMEMKRDQAGRWILFRPAANHTTLAISLFQVAANVIRCLHPALEPILVPCQPFPDPFLVLKILLTLIPTVDVVRTVNGFATVLASRTGLFGHRHKSLHR